MLYVLNKNMRTHSIIKTINTAGGETVTFIQEEGNTLKMHSMEGPALIHPKDSKKAPEYYLYGIKYSKSQWLERVAKHAVVPENSGWSLDY